jgi:hypothetical protein
MDDRKYSRLAREFFRLRNDRAKRQALIRDVLFVGCLAGYGFWDGYHQGRSVEDALISAAAAVIAVAIVHYLLKRREIQGKS